jgi:hypothetical protein
MFTQGGEGVDSGVCVDLAVGGCVLATLRHVSGMTTTQPNGHSGQGVGLESLRLA